MSCWPEVGCDDLLNRDVPGRPGASGISAAKDVGWLSLRGRWYGKPGTIWGAAFQHVFPSSNVVWYQWQMVCDVKRVKDLADAAAAGQTATVLMKGSSNERQAECIIRIVATS